MLINMIILVPLSGVYFVTSFVSTFETVFRRCTPVYIYINVCVCLCVCIVQCLVDAGPTT